MGFIHKPGGPVLEGAERSFEAASIQREDTLFIRSLFPPDEDDGAAPPAGLPLDGASDCQPCEVVRVSLAAAASGGAAAGESWRKIRLALEELKAVQYRVGGKTIVQATRLTAPAATYLKKLVVRQEQITG
jgi:hypothetical protein